MNVQEKLVEAHGLLRLAASALLDAAGFADGAMAGKLDVSGLIDNLGDSVHSLADGVEEASQAYGFAKFTKVHHLEVEAADVDTTVVHEGSPTLGNPEE